MAFERILRMLYTRRGGEVINRERSRLIASQQERVWRCCRRRYTSYAGRRFIPMHAYAVTPGVARFRKRKRRSFARQQRSDGAAQVACATAHVTPTNVHGAARASRVAMPMFFLRYRRSHDFAAAMVLWQSFAATPRHRERRFTAPLPPVFRRVFRLRAILGRPLLLPGLHVPPFRLLACSKIEDEGRRG